MKRIILLLFTICSLAQAEIVDTFQFHSPEAQQRAIALAKTLRCPQCQNQNLVESNAAVAYDLRLEVYQMVNQGKSNDEIIAIMTDSFGNFVRYDPPFTTNTYFLWLLPLFGVILALVCSGFYLYKRKQTRHLSVQQQQQLQAFLQQQDHHD
ncbi:cytochrome C biosynthesis protein [Gallibacterium genomosp. 3]|uniref:Formate-dependent nitrite reductase complex subunit n=1 Tax=Gallibacterium genomosp. 3 TaxID=505345 RepID=A0A1A7NNZ0_9PAST|nr:heme lyase NrfEFG subunit NrfF [Gallibacterium genomosp. 3]OBW91231.1 cytochrome C biosynthesis protein [Gallibacterium genomosp. 3]